MQISERDWKIFREKISDWQERYMERLEIEYIALLQNEKTLPLNSGKWKNVSSKKKNRQAL